MEVIRGRVWFFQDNVDTDQILPGYAMAESFDNLGNFAMVGSDMPDFPKKVNKGDIIVAGNNFGCGSSREQAPVSLQKAGVSLVIAKSFARIFRRNAINIGLPVLIADLKELVKTGDTISVDLEKGLIQSGEKALEFKALSSNVLATLNAGGLINRVRQELAAQ